MSTSVYNQLWDKLIEGKTTLAVPDREYGLWFRQELISSGFIPSTVHFEVTGGNYFIKVILND